jgi:hypothetical protein
MDIIDYRNKVKKVKIDLNNSQNLWAISDKRPQIEKDLTIIQRKYFKEKDPAKKHILWQDMFVLIKKYARSLILKKKKGGKYTDPEIIEDQSIQVALVFMSQYLYRPDFFVGVSFAGMMNGKVLETLYKQLPDDDNFSLNETINDSEHEFEDIQDTIMESIFREMPLPEECLYKVSITDIVHELLKEFDSLVKDEKVKLKLRFYIFILLKKPRNKHIFPTFFKYQCNKKELDLIQLFELELYQRIKNGMN